MEHLVGPKGQVVISKEIRDQLGIGPGWRAVQRRVGDRVELTFLPPKHRRSLQGALGSKLRRRAADPAEEASAWESEARAEWLQEEGDA